MTSITLEVPDELAERLAPIRAQLPRLLSLALEMMSLNEEPAAPHSDLRSTFARLDALNERVRKWQAEHGVVDVDSITLLRELREERDRELSGLH